MKSTYQIRYNHTSSRTATSLEAAIRDVRLEARVARIYRAAAPDGTYCYKSAADMRRDDTGARAYAVICAPNQQAE